MMRKRLNAKEKRAGIVAKPRRISHTYVQTINGTLAEIMPLYCPVRELDWCENWNPKAVYSQSGLVEKDCIFITPDGDTDIVWMVNDYNPEAGHVEMMYHVPGVLITKLEIQATAVNPSCTQVKLTYSKTALSEKGDKALAAFTQKEYTVMMDSWEKAMNHYLASGEMLTGLPNF
ncbi:hypothetical protein [uncultured Draconibacterium sp.]|uniref:hypothetical protein n=1 Tax=uncultured Draconibacterium sp. TaxID=1573823 RepID=UPI0025DCE8D5|nr:hypothetical protein [uncultured Draconibacterium sp.]